MNHARKNMQNEVIQHTKGDKLKPKSTECDYSHFDRVTTTLLCQQD